MRVVVDSSVLSAIAFSEKGSERLAERLAGASLHAPVLLKYEMTQVAVTKARKDRSTAPQIFDRLRTVLDRRRGIHWHDVSPTDVALLASVTGLSAYDATYMWLAGSLGADLITFDKKLAAAAGFEVESMS